MAVVLSPMIHSPAACGHARIHSPAACGHGHAAPHVSWQAAAEWDSRSAHASVRWHGCGANPPSGTSAGAQQQQQQQAHAAVPTAAAASATRHHEQHHVPATTSPFAGLRVAPPNPSPFANLRVAPAAPPTTHAASPFAGLRVVLPPAPAAWASPFANLKAAGAGSMPEHSRGLAAAAAAAATGGGRAGATASTLRGTRLQKRGGPAAQLKWLKRVCLAAGKKRKAMSSSSSAATGMLAKVLNQNFTRKLQAMLGRKDTAAAAAPAPSSVFGDSLTSPFAQVVRAAAAAAVAAKGN